MEGQERVDDRRCDEGLHDQIIKSEVKVSWVLR